MIEDTHRRSQELLVVEGSASDAVTVQEVSFWNMSAASAEQVTGQISALLDRAWEYIALAYKGRAFLSLGYANWDEYVDARFGKLRITVPRESRTQVVSTLAGVQMSYRAIANLLGVGVATVHRELNKSGVPRGTAGEEGSPSVIIGRDGKSYRRRVSLAPCSTCGETHSPELHACPWDEFARGAAPRPTSNELEYGSPSADASSVHGRGESPVRRPGLPDSIPPSPIADPAVPPRQSVEAVAIRDLITQAESLLGALPEVIAVLSRAAFDEQSLDTVTIDRLEQIAEAVTRLSGIARRI